MTDLIKRNWNDKLCILLDSDTGEPVKIGSYYKDRDCAPMKLTGGYAPHKPSSSGKVHVEIEYDGQTHSREFYPSVINAEWRELELKAKEPRYWDEDWQKYWGDQIHQWQHGATHFTSKLLSLYDKGDNGNRSLLAKSYPDMAKAHEMWFKGGFNEAV